MPLVNPKYLDMPTPLALAGYHEVDFPRAQEIVERSTQSRSLAFNAAVAGVGARAGGGRDMEVQRTYSLAPADKAVVSRVLDRLRTERHVVELSPTTRLSRGTAVEVEASGD